MIPKHDLPILTVTRETYHPDQVRYCCEGEALDRDISEARWLSEWLESERQARKKIEQ